jgi:hypothetical protein
MLVTTRHHDGLVDHLAKDESVKPAARDAWNILSQTLADRAWAWATLGTHRIESSWSHGVLLVAARAVNILE